MKAEIYKKNKKTHEVKFLRLIENITSAEIVSNTAILRGSETHYFDLDEYALCIENE